MTFSELNLEPHEVAEVRQFISAVKHLGATLAGGVNGLVRRGQPIDLLQYQALKARVIGADGNGGHLQQMTGSKVLPADDKSLDEFWLKRELVAQAMILAKVLDVLQAGVTVDGKEFGMNDIMIIAQKGAETIT